MATIYKPTQVIQLLRSTARRPLSIPNRKNAARAAFSTSRNAQATHKSSNTTSNNTTANDILSSHPAIPTRRRVTITNDTGAVRWSDLSPGEKASRTAQQSLNFTVVFVGIVATGVIAYFIFSDILSPNSKTAYFNRATTLIRAHPECQKLLGPGSEISAHGESSWSRWRHNRHIHSTEETDKWGTEHLRFRFYVEGPLNQGTAICHLTKRPSQDEWEWCELVVNIKGGKTVWVERADGKAGSKVAPKIFGARWW